MKAAAIILSGGKSSRMGTNKALLKINGETNLERIISRLKPLFDATILVTNHPDDYRFLNINMTGDEYPGFGPLAGVHAGLKASPFETNLVAACDMPFVSTELAQALIEKSRGFDAVVPVIYGKQHPLFAVFQKKVTPIIEECLRNKQLRMKHLFDRLDVLYVTEMDFPEFPDLERIFFNMNHPDEYAEVVEWAKER
jgi:molybdopterin-guanine dinucleotide biosynthesis protein A